MDDMTNLKAFVTAARTGNFSKAARELGVAPSVMSKRIDQLEWKIRSKLFHRSTRSVSLTTEGESYLNRARALVIEFDETIVTMTKRTQALVGKVRIKAPTTLTINFLGSVLNQFQHAHPDIRIDLELLDRPVNPIVEGFDIAIGGFPPTFDGVLDIPLGQFRRVVCASPKYLAVRGKLSHPRELALHDTLCYKATGPIWTFESRRGPISVSLLPKLIANEGQVLRDAAIDGHGILLISSYIVEESLQNGTLEPILDDYQISDMWFKAVVPERVFDSPIVSVLLDWLKASFARDPRWSNPI